METPALNNEANTDAQRRVELLVSEDQCLNSKLHQYGDTGHIADKKTGKVIAFFSECKVCGGGLYSDLLTSKANNIRFLQPGTFEVNVSR